jgi:integrase
VARTIGKLTALAVSRATAPAYYGDGGGLYLQVSTGGARSWVYRFKLNGRPRMMGLGPLHTISLSEARARATACRRQRLDGIDPIEARKARRNAVATEAAKAVVFADCAARYIEAHKPGWRNKKHGAQWIATLTAYACSVFGQLPVHAVDTGLVLKALEPIWTTKPETASRVRGRIESVLDWATARGYRQGDNPARWRGHLDHLLPARATVQKVEHHPALPYTEIRPFVETLRAQPGTSARALEFLVLTAARTGEVIGATWQEIDLKSKVWIVPAERIKGGKEHRVPLSARVLAILEEMKDLRRDGDFVFPGGKRGRPLSNSAMLALLERMKRDDLTAHGFRSTFRDWAAERTNYPRDVAEMALAHVIGDKVEAAYRRGDLFEKRRRLMEEWARYCGIAKAPGGAVVPMHATA